MLLWVVYSLISAFFFGLKDIIAKKIVKHDTNPKQIVFEEYALLLLIVLLFFYPLVDFSSFSDYWLLYSIKAFSVSFSFIIYLKLLKTHDISSVSPLLNLSPFILLILSSIFLAEVITFIQFIGIIIIIGSTFFLEVTIHHHKKEKPHKFCWNDLKSKNVSFFLSSFFMLLLFSIAAMSDSLILENVNVYTNMYFTAFIIFSISILYYLIEREFLECCKKAVMQPKTLIVGFFTIVSNFFVLLAIASPGALISLIIPLRRTSTLVASLGGGLLFHEKHLKRKTIATIFMIIGVIFIVSSGTSFVLE